MAQTTYLMENKNINRFRERVLWFFGIDLGLPAFIALVGLKAWICA